MDEMCDGLYTFRYIFALSFMHWIICVDMKVVECFLHLMKFMGVGVVNFVF